MVKYKKRLQEKRHIKEERLEEETYKTDHRNKISVITKNQLIRQNINFKLKLKKFFVIKKLTQQSDYKNIFIKHHREPFRLTLSARHYGNQNGGLLTQ